MSVVNLAEIAADVTWLWPDAQTILTLNEGHEPFYGSLRRDVGGTLVFLASLADDCPPTGQPPRQLPGAIYSHFVQQLLRQLSRDGGTWLDWRKSSLQGWYAWSVWLANASQVVAEKVESCHPDWAWHLGMMIPVGWLQLLASHPAAVRACLADDSFNGDPDGTQRRHWGMSHDEIRRRLVHRFNFPQWMRGVLSHLDIAPDLANELGMDGRILAGFQLAAGLAAEAGCPLKLLPSERFAQAAKLLELDEDDLRPIREQCFGFPIREVIDFTPADPRGNATWITLLHQSLEQPRAVRIDTLERDYDRLHRRLQATQLDLRERIKTAKLESMAELAAGAGHEINNPLAVIKGHSESLRKRTENPADVQSIEVIQKQVQRIHLLVKQLMQFARPPRPVVAPVTLADWLTQFRERKSLAAAREKGVDVELIPGPLNVTLDVDAEQLSLAVEEVLRNAVDACGSPGWVRLRVEKMPTKHVRLILENSGPPPTAEQAEHLFDPFYSGRNAGRGVGMGLPVAWRLIRENGGDLRHETASGGPTRFAFYLPFAAGDEPIVLRKVG